MFLYQNYIKLIHFIHTLSAVKANSYLHTSVLLYSSLKTIE